MTIELTRIQHVKIPVTDLSRSMAWYRDLLELELTHEFAEGGVVRGVSLLHRGGGFSIALRDRAAIPGRPDLRGFDPFALDVVDPDGTVVRFYHLTAEPSRFTGLAFGADGSVEFYDEPTLEERRNG